MRLRGFATLQDEGKYELIAEVTDNNQQAV